METKPPFEDHIESYSKEIFSYIWRMVYSHQDAEDCLQETYLRAFRAYPKLIHKASGNNRTNYRAWLYKIATNVVRTCNRRHANLASRTSDFDTNLTHPGVSIPEQVAYRLLLQDIRAAADRLPHKQRAALFMRKYQQMSYPEIAHALNCSADSARANVYQALRKLREQFQMISDSPPERPLL